MKKLINSLLLFSTSLGMVSFTKNYNIKDFENNKDIYLSKVNKYSNDQYQKTIITNYDIKDFSIFIKENESENDIKKDVFRTMAEKNKAAENIAFLVDSIIKDTNLMYWEIENIKFIKPNQNSEINFKNVRIIAKDQNMSFFGSFSFNVKFIRGTVTPEKPKKNLPYTEYVNRTNSTIGNEVDAKSRWLIAIGSDFTINIKDYKDSVYQFRKDINNFELKFYITVKDGSTYGGKTLIDEEYIKNLSINNVVTPWKFYNSRKIEKEKPLGFDDNGFPLYTYDWKYKNYLNNPEKFYDSLTDDDKNNVVMKFKHDYAQNKVYAAAVIDYYTSVDGIMHFRLITISGKFASKWNNSNVQCKVSAKFLSVKIS
ncbi:hypothetical protein [Spiroplasma tabanidicola]|uniref:Uncharacterized protein n=1 Tax=Spiroplasma tabanidicola TaxID=324079 RepID=A0A6I6CBH3_9MOLU|nr:hypothetical protein [Spiroplasma tabanidicola]QGS52301.1 hypothetical protein STABA_v1c09480 [Spiroplasma tabanidicola]